MVSLEVVWSDGVDSSCPWWFDTIHPGYGLRTWSIVSAFAAFVKTPYPGPAEFGCTAREYARGEKRAGRDLNTRPSG